MHRYHATFTGNSPMLHHQDNLSFSEVTKAWQTDPANKELSVKGDDRSPAWTWMGYLYHNGKFVGLPTDNIMTCIREGGAKVPTGKGSETYKKQSQSGILIMEDQFEFLVDGKQIAVSDLDHLSDCLEFTDHLETAQRLGFELLVKRAKIGQAKHVRVRPMFTNWVASGELIVIDEELSGLKQPILKKILEQAGAQCGIGDWRPSSPRSPGRFGTFGVTLKFLGKQ